MEEYENHEGADGPAERAGTPGQEPRPEQARQNEQAHPPEPAQQAPARHVSHSTPHHEGRNHTRPNDDVSGGTLLKILAMVLIILAVGYGGYKFVTAPLVEAKDVATSAVTLLDGPPEGDVQKVTLSIDNTGRYAPYPLKLKEGVPVELTTDQNIRGCGRNWFSPSLGIQGSAQAGKNIMYFVPNKKGNFPFSCSMNMFKGMFVVE